MFPLNAPKKGKKRTAKKTPALRSPETIADPLQLETTVFPDTAVKPKTTVVEETSALEKLGFVSADNTLSGGITSRGFSTNENKIMKTTQSNTENQPLSVLPVMPRAISNQDLAEAQSKLQESFKPIQEVFDRCKAEFEEAKTELENSFKELLSIYYDQELRDANNNAVRIGAIITDGKDFYSVFDRGRQIIFGAMLFNNSVKCYKLDKDLRPGKKVHFFGPSELARFSLHVA